ncbi:Hypothetical protein D9617_17g047630 [Elsinoe fawcettii]|nr:Hypothetical protein D9617_17g047630 [Elsinoe fawcettii]
MMPEVPAFFSRDESILDWWHTKADLLAAKANLRRLAFELDFSEGGIRERKFHSLSRFMREKRRELYTTLFQPAIALRDLKKLFVYIRSEGHRGDAERWYVLEQYLDKMVKGPEYDTGKDGKKFEDEVLG